MTFNTFYTSTHIAHATSATPVGPWTRAGVAVPPAAGNPAMSRAPDGTWLLYFTNHRYEGKLRDCTGPVDSWGVPAYYNRTFPVNKSDTCGSKGYGEPFGISLAYSKSLSGPWTIRYDVITVPASNPGGPLFMEDGSLMLPFQSWPKATPCQDPACITIVTAKSWDDFPYSTYPLGNGDGYSSDRSSCIERWPCNSSACAKFEGHALYGSVEDPSNIWRDKRGNLHVLMHQAHKGGRAWSEDLGRSWHYAYNTTSYPFSPTVDDGSEIDCLLSPGSSRGEPRVLLDQKTGLPSVLSTVCFRGDGPPAAAGGERQFWSRILLQRINTRSEPVAPPRRDLKLDDHAPLATDDFSISLRPDFRLSWTIHEDAGTIDATMSTNSSGWLGFGLSPSSFFTFHGMNHADIVAASWPAHKSPGQGCTISDMYNDNDFEVTPKLDQALGGTDDVTNASCARVDGWTHARWSRRLATGDFKADWNITSGFNHVILAYGSSGELAYHGPHNTAVCELSFHLGKLKAPCKVFW